MDAESEDELELDDESDEESDVDQEWEVDCIMDQKGEGKRRKNQKCAANHAPG